jgi:hypothetical protein
VLGEEEFEALKSVTGSMPAWMRAAMQENERMVENKQLQARLEAGLEEAAPTPIPPTSLSPLRYLGGIAALNLPLPEPTGDWHMIETFFRPQKNGWRPRSFISGVGCETDTVAFFGDEGIYDCTETLDKLGIPHESAVAYAANHARATADLVIVSILSGESPNYVVLDDWMPRDSDKEDVHYFLDQARPHLTAEQQVALRAWVAKNPFDYHHG